MHQRAEQTSNLHENFVWLQQEKSLVARGKWWDQYKLNTKYPLMFWWTVNFTWKRVVSKGGRGHPLQYSSSISCQISRLANHQVSKIPQNCSQKKGNSVRQKNTFAKKLNTTLLLMSKKPFFPTKSLWKSSFVCWFCHQHRCLPDLTNMFIHRLANAVTSAFFHRLELSLWHLQISFLFQDLKMALECSIKRV